jgi:hypothetical protein
LAVALIISSLVALTPARAQVGIEIQVDLAPPPLPVYDQPPMPDDGYLWAPGYWLGTTTSAIIGCARDVGVAAVSRLVVDARLMGLG